MAVDTPCDPTAPRPAFQEGMDGLWKFQLRKENATLLEKQDTSAKQLQQIITDAIKNKTNFEERMAVLEAQTIKNRKEFDERMASLETTILNLQSEGRRERLAFERYGEEMATLRLQMRIMMDKLETHDYQCAGVEGTGPHLGISSSQDGSAVSELPETTADASGNTNTNTYTQQPAPTSIKTSKQVPVPVPAPMTTPELHATNHTAKVSLETVGRTTRSRSKSLSAEAPTFNQPRIQPPIPDIRTPSAVPTSTPTATAGVPIKLSRLHQGHSSYKSYLDKANSAFDSLPRPVEHKLEIEFIAMFIQGITNQDKRNFLVAELQQQHQSRRKKDGKTEILCEWRQVAEGMKAAGLLQAGTSGARNGPKQKHRGNQFKS